MGVQELVANTALELDLPMQAMLCYVAVRRGFSSRLW